MMQDWFEEAKLGIFVHWGAYAVGCRGGESWPLVSGTVSYDDYLEEAKRFDASEYDPAAWVDLFRRAGARYAVLTTKHHDGVTLFPTRHGSPSLPELAGVGDLVEPFVDALRDAGLRVGLYYSHTDWYSLDHLEVITGLSRDELREMRKRPVTLSKIWQADQANDRSGDEHLRKAWDRFLAFHEAQLVEILERYHPVDLIWFDVMLDRKGYTFPVHHLREVIHGINPNTVINSRLGEAGDYETPEQFVPVRRPDGPWELCMTVHNTWSYTGKEEGYKSAYQLLTMFCECLGMGGNMLLNVGPDAHGRLPPQQTALLEAIGRWTSKHAEAIYGTVAGLPLGYAYHFSSMNKAKDVIYLYVAHVPKETTSIKGIRNNLERVTVLGDGAACSWQRVGGAPWLNVPGTLFIEVPKASLDPDVTVLKIELDGPLDLYSGEGVEIDIN